MVRARGESYAKNKDGDRSFEVAKNEAQAIETEGLNKAVGLKKLAEAYARGGDGLVKEALAAKLKGTVLHGRPYSLRETIERIQVDRSGKLPAAIGGSSRK